MNMYFDDWICCCCPAGPATINNYLCWLQATFELTLTGLDHIYIYIYISLQQRCLFLVQGLTHRGPVTHKCVNEICQIGLKNGLVPVRHQAIIWSNDCFFAIVKYVRHNSLWTVNWNTAISIQQNEFVLSAKCLPFCLSLNVMTRGLMTQTHPPGKGVVPGPRLNIKTVLSTYGDFHVKDKTAVRTSYL